MILALTLVFGAGAFAYLGLLVLRPAEFGWPGAGRLQPIIGHWVAATPVGRPEWGVMTLLVAAAFALAAWPKPVSDPPRRAARQAMAPDLRVEPESAEEPGLDPVIDMGEPPPLQQVAVLVEAPAPVVQPVHAPTLSVDHDTEVAGARFRLNVEPSTEARIRLADLLKKSGDIADAERRPDLAGSSYQESITLRRRIIADDPDDAVQHRWLWMTLEALADGLEARSLRSRALALYDEALVEAERTVALAPNMPGVAADLAESRTRRQALAAYMAAL